LIEIFLAFDCSLQSPFTILKHVHLKEKAEDEEERAIESKEIEALREKFEDEGQLDPDACVMKVIREAEEVWEPVIQPIERKDTKKSKVQAKKSRNRKSDREEVKESESQDQDEEHQLPEGEREAYQEEKIGTGGLTDGTFRVEFKSGFKRKQGGESKLPINIQEGRTN
jgi:hypothetical protein